MFFLKKVSIWMLKPVLCFTLSELWQPVRDSHLMRQPKKQTFCGASIR